MRKVLLLVLVGACHRAPAPVQSCADNLSGTWRADDDRQSQFKIVDDGKRVTLTPLYAVSPDYGPFTTTLSRTGAGTLAGTTTTTYSQSGKTCPIRFASTIDSCKDGVLELAGESQFDIDLPTCRTTSTGVMQIAHLRRE